jgi:hypothetical protein
LDLVGAFLEEEEACKAARAQVRERLPVREIHERFCCRAYLPPSALYDLLGPAVICQFFRQVRIWRQRWYLGSSLRTWVWAVSRRQVGKWRVATNIRSTTT